MAHHGGDLFLDETTRGQNPAPKIDTAPTVIIGLAGADRWRWWEMKM